MDKQKLLVELPDVLALSRLTKTALRVLHVILGRVKDGSMVASITLDEIAAAMNTPRNVVCRGLAVLREHGWVTRERVGRLKVHNVSMVRMA